MTLRRRLIAARVAYVAIVLLATLTQLELSGDLTSAGERLARAFAPSVGWGDAIDGLRNVTLFAGLGALWVVTSLSGNVALAVREATVVGLGLSAGVESVQVFSPVRIASLLDLTTNTIGAFAGAVLVAWAIWMVRAAKGGRSYLGVPAFLLTGGYTVAVVCEALTPLFRSEVLEGIGGGPLSRLRVMLDFAEPVSFWGTPMLDVVLFAPAGFLLVLLIKENESGSGRWWLVALVTGVLAVVLEVAHGMLALPISWSAAGVHAVALAFGAWAAHQWIAPLTQALRGGARARAAIFAYGILLVVWGWRPFLPETDLSAIAAQFTADHLIPLRSLSVRADAFSALHVAQQFSLYLPLGSVLAVWPLRTSGPWSHLRSALWFATALELGHALIVQRYFDVTNVMVAVAGLGIGWIVVRRSGFVPYGSALSG